MGGTNWSHWMLEDVMQNIAGAMFCKVACNARCNRTLQARRLSFVSRALALPVLSFVNTPNNGDCLSVRLGTSLGSYRMDSLLGKGGMGEVYRAKDTKPNRQVAIKVLPDGFSQNS